MRAAFFSTVAAFAAMSQHPRTAWQPHPDPALEAAFSTGGAAELVALLRLPGVQSDRYAHLRILDRLHELMPGDDKVLMGWMQAMLVSNRPSQVWSVVRAWADDSTLDPALALVAAQVAQTVGESGEARTRYRRLLDRYPAMVDAWQKYLDFEAHDAVGADDLEQVTRLFRDPSSPYNREKAGFALAGYHARSAPGHAFELASEAHRLKRERLGPWDGTQLARRLAADRSRRLSPAGEGPAPRPVFIVGLPRSGTTLLTGMLHAHSQVAGVGEQNLIPALAATACRDPLSSDPRLPAFVGRWYRAAVGDLASGARLVVDKLPSNVEHIGLILAMFPDALVLHLQRDLADCAMSIHLRDFEFGCRYADTAVELADYADQVGRHALHWHARAPGRVLPLRYEDIVRDPSSALAPFFAAAGISWEAGMLDFWRRREQVATFSESQVRRPLNADSVDAWRRFLPEAGAYLRTLGIQA